MTLCFSPCPNDTFIFDALVHNRIDTEDLSFDIHLADVEELNTMVRKHQIDFCKISYHAFVSLQDKYVMCTAGSALGRGNGPLLVSKYKIYPDEVSNLKIAIPGVHTTAAFLLKMAFPKLKQPIPYLFSDIEEAILTNEVDAGVLIHEGRFTYASKDLQLITDLGLFWENECALPLPLGGIAMNKNLDQATQDKFTRVLKRSIQFAMSNPSVSAPYVQQHAKELSSSVCQKHIELFVNDFTLDLGKEGKSAVAFFLEKAEKSK